MAQHTEEDMTTHQINEYFDAISKRCQWAKPQINGGNLNLAYEQVQYIRSLCTSIELEIKKANVAA